METLSRRYKPARSRVLYCLFAGLVGLGLSGLALAEMKPSLELRHPAANQEPGSFLVAPANDECTGAISIPGTSPACSDIVTDVRDATPDEGTAAGPDPATCIQAVGYMANSIWFTYVPASTSFFNIFTCLGESCGPGETQTTAGDGLLAIYSSAGGCSGPFTMGGCDDDSCGQTGPPPQGSPSNIGPISLTGGTTYYITAGNFSNATYFGTVSQYQIRIEETPPPPNDQCANAEPLFLDIPVNGVINSITLNDYQAPTGGTSCYHSAICETNTGPDTCIQIGNIDSAGTGGDVAYSFEAPSDGGYSFHLKYLQNGDPASVTPPNSILYISGTCPASSGQIPSCLYAANRVGLGGTAGISNLNGSEEVLCLYLAAGQTVFPIVDLALPTGDNNKFVIEAFRCNLEREFNGNPFSADDVDTDGDGIGEGPNSVSLGCPVEGQITTFPGFPDIDFYTLGINPLGSRLFAVANCDAANPRTDGANATDIDMRVTTATDTIEFDDQDSPIPFGTFCPDVAGTPLPDVPAYIRLNAFSTTISYEPYRLHTTIRPPGPNPPFVNGIGTTAEAEPAEPHGTRFADYVYASMSADPAGDLDQFGFAANKGDSIMVNVDFDPTRDATPGRGFFRLFDFTTQHFVPAPYEFVNFSTAGAVSSMAPSPGTLTGTSPRSPGNAIVWTAQNTGVYLVQVYNVLAPPPSFGPADYLYQASLNCDSGGIRADLAIDKTGPASVTAGQDITYTITVTNNGPNPAIFADWIEDIPAGTTFVSLDSSGAPEWTCFTPPETGDTFIECDEDTLAFNGSVVFLLTVHVPECSGNFDVSNTAYVESFLGRTADPNLANNESTANTTVTDPGTCDDGLFCTVNDHCSYIGESGAGVCIGGGPRDCSDGNQCTDDSCDEDADQCVSVVDDSNVCSDGNACTTVDTCEGGQCVGSVPPNCNDGNNNTDDSCDPRSGCVNHCNGSGNFHGYGFYKRLCRGPHPSGEFLSQVDVDCVNETCTFASVSSVRDLCDRLTPNPSHDKCEQAEAQFMTLLLNDCRCALGHHQPVSASCGSATTVQEAINGGDNALCEPGRTHQDCILSQACNFDPINNGSALWANSLRVTKNGSTVNLDWTAPYSSPDGQTAQGPQWYRIFARSISEAPMVQVGQVNGNTLNFQHVNLGGDTQYEVIAIW